MLIPGQQTNLGIISQVYDMLNQVYKAYLENEAHMMVTMDCFLRSLGCMCCFLYSLISDCASPVCVSRGGGGGGGGQCHVCGFILLPPAPT